MHRDRRNNATCNLGLLWGVLCFARKRRDGHCRLCARACDTLADGITPPSGTSTPHACSREACSRLTFATLGDHGNRRTRVASVPNKKRRLRVKSPRLIVMWS